MRTLGEETCFEELLATGNPCFHDKMLYRRPERILDVGCQHGEILYLLYHSYDFIKHREGWEIRTEADVLKQMKDSDQRAKRQADYNSLFERYGLCIGNVLAGRPVMRTESAFRSALNLRFSTDAFEVDPPELGFDMIVMSNLFNDFDHQRCAALLGKLYPMAASNALYYIHFRDRPHYNVLQRRVFGWVNDVCQEFSRGVGLSLFERLAANGERHFSYTNLMD